MKGHHTAGSFLKSTMDYVIQLERLHMANTARLQTTNYISVNKTQRSPINRELAREAVRAQECDKGVGVGGVRRERARNHFYSPTLPANFSPASHGFFQWYSTIKK